MKVYVGTRCTECGRGPMVSAKAKVVPAGAVRHRMGGKCASCWGKWKWKQLHPDAVSYKRRDPTVPEDKHARNLQALESYLTARRRRGIPPEGRGHYDDALTA